MWKRRGLSGMQGGKTSTVSYSRSMPNSLIAMQVPKPLAMLLAGLAAGALLAGCATEAGRSAQTLAGAASITQTGPVDPEKLIGDAEAALERKQFREAAELYGRAASGSEDETLIAQAAKVAYEFRQMSVVRQVANHWLSINPTSEAATRYAAFAALDLYQLDEAATHFDALLNAAYINTAAGFLGLAPQLGEQGTPAAVTAVLRQLVAKYPDVAEGHHALGQAALRSEHMQLALESAQRAHQLSPYWSPAGLFLARMQLVVNDTEAGLATARTVIERDGSPGNRLEYALLLVAASREAEGMAELEAYRTTSDDAALIVERILALRDLEAGRTEAAASRFDDLIRKGAFVYESLFYLGGLAEQRQSWEEARQNYSKIKADDFAVQAQSRIGRILADHATLDAALAWLAAFADEKPQYAVDMIVARSRLLEESGDTAGARLLLDQGLEAYPDAYDLAMARSYLFERTDDVRRAVADLEKLHAQRNGDPAVLNALGYLLVDRTRRYKEGYEMVRQAHEQTPDSGPVLDSMGWALHRLGRNEEALPYLEQARARIYDPEIELHIGDVFWALGRREDARMTWQQGSERHPDDGDFRERLERHFRQ